MSTELDKLTEHAPLTRAALKVAESPILTNREVGFSIIKHAIDLESRLNTAKADAVAKTSALDQAVAELQQVKKDLADKDQLVATVSSENDGLKGEIAILEASVNGERSSRKAAEAERDALKARVEELERINSNHVDAIAYWKGQWNSQTALLEQAERKLAEYERPVDEVESQAALDWLLTPDEWALVPLARRESALKVLAGCDSYISVHLKAGRILARAYRQQAVKNVDLRMKVEYVERMGIQFGMIKSSDKPEPYLAHVWAEDSQHERMFREWSHSIGWEEREAALKQQIKSLEDWKKEASDKLFECGQKLERQRLQLAQFDGAETFVSGVRGCLQYSGPSLDGMSPDFSQTELHKGDRVLILRAKPGAEGGASS